MENNKQPAFPFIFHENTEDQWTSTGLTKREYFAVKILSGLSIGNYGDGEKSDNIRLLISDTLEITDELLKQLEK